jgi:hypothetical protein
MDTMACIGSSKGVRRLRRFLLTSGLALALPPLALALCGFPEGHRVVSIAWCSMSQLQNYPKNAWLCLKFV